MPEDEIESDSDNNDGYRNEIGSPKPPKHDDEGQYQRNQSWRCVAKPCICPERPTLPALRKPIGNLTDPDRERGNAATAEGTEQQQPRILRLAEMIRITRQQQPVETGDADDGKKQQDQERQLAAIVVDPCPEWNAQQRAGQHGDCDKDTDLAWRQFHDVDEAVSRRTEQRYRSEPDEKSDRRTKQCLVRAADDAPLSLNAGSCPVHQRMSCLAKAGYVGAATCGRGLGKTKPRISKIIRVGRPPLSLPTLTG